MFRVRRASERGHYDHGWLDTRHTFSFGEYDDPEHRGFRALRVINEDRVAPGQGFGMHGHRDMEIVTVVLSGALEHRDSLGNGEVLKPGEVQRMTAGTGIRHGEFNPSPVEASHFYQIWIFPERGGLPPSYDQRPFPEEGRRGRWQLVASPNAEDGALEIRQDARLLLANLEGGQSLSYDLAPGRHAWLQVARGGVTAGGHELSEGDGLAVSAEDRLDISAPGHAELLLFDLA